MLKNLKSWQAISSNQRNSSVDIFRAIAIISVVIFHFNDFFPFGSLGVDLFFVISGFLIGGIFIKELDQGRPISFGKFFLARGFKIWPSYYVFILAGNFFAFLFYSTIAPDQFIPFWDIMRYLLFYQNYTGLPFHWSFDHVWSMCVEEHFYILLPILFIVVQGVFIKKKKWIFIFVFCVIGAGVLFKALAFEFTRSKDTYSATHNRIDALAWGVLLSLLINYYPVLFKKTKTALPCFIIGLLLLGFSVMIEAKTASVIYHKIILHSIAPFSFFLMIAGSYYTDLSRLKYFRLIAYYSYNWYLWHPIFVIGITYLIGDNLLALILYLVFTFAIAVLFTILIEEPGLKFRRWIS